jgi:HK97 gp10 family phage protein
MVIEVHNLDKCIKKFGDISKIDLTKPISRSAIAVQNRARDQVPVDTGELQQSIQQEPLGGDYNYGARIIANKEYAYWVEFGASGPHFVPFTINGKDTGIRGWAVRHGIDVTNKTGLMVSGKAQPFLRPAFQQERKQITRRVADHISREVTKISKK